MKKELNIINRPSLGGAIKKKKGGNSEILSPLDITQK